MVTLLLAAAQTLVGLWSYSAFDYNGYKIAYGTITLRQPTSAERKQTRVNGPFYLGSKQITCLNPKKYGPHSQTKFPPNIELPPELRTEVVFAGVQEGKVHLDLNYRWADRNIWLNGDLDGHRITGTWEWATIAGIRNQGKFSMVRMRSQVKHPSRRHS
jgi:hypothetical protein